MSEWTAPAPPTWQSSPHARLHSASPSSSGEALSTSLCPRVYVLHSHARQKLKKYWWRFCGEEWTPAPHATPANNPKHRWHVAALTVLHKTHLPRPKLLHGLCRGTHEWFLYDQVMEVPRFHAGQHYRTSGEAVGALEPHFGTLSDETEGLQVPRVCHEYCLLCTETSLW